MEVSPEFAALREEILAWQERRFTVLTGTVTLVCVMLGFIFSDAKNSWSRQHALTILFAVLGCAALVTWYAGRASAARGAYLAVFYEHELGSAHWERAIRIAAESDRLSRFTSLNTVIAFVFGSVACAAGSAIWAHCKPEAKKASTIACLVSATFLIAMLLLSTVGASTHDAYRKLFVEIKNELAKSPHQLVSPSDEPNTSR